MSKPLIVITLALFATLCASCKKRPATVQRPPGEAATDEPQDQPPPDSLQVIGAETAVLVGLWVKVLEQVKTEADVDEALKRLERISEQFGPLQERAEKLPALDPVELKKVDEQVEPLIRNAASGLEAETQRIFLLPDPIKSKVLPAHQQLMSKFRDMSRAINASSSSKSDATSP